MRSAKFLDIQSARGISDNPNATFAQNQGALKPSTPKNALDTTMREVMREPVSIADPGGLALI